VRDAKKRGEKKEKVMIFRVSPRELTSALIDPRRDYSEFGNFNLGGGPEGKEEKKKKELLS